MQNWDKEKLFSFILEFIFEMHVYIKTIKVRDRDNIIPHYVWYQLFDVQSNN